MKFTFPIGQSKKRDEILSVDLGGRTTKAVLLQRNGKGFKLARYTVKEAPVYEKTFSPAMLSEHLRDVAQSLQPKTRQVLLSVSAADSILRGIELPLLPVNQMRQMLRLNSKAYLQHDLSDHTFDCYIVPPDPKNGEVKKIGGSEGRDPEIQGLGRWSEDQFHQRRPISRQDSRFDPRRNGVDDRGPGERV